MNLVEKEWRLHGVMMLLLTLLFVVDIATHHGFANHVLYVIVVLTYITQRVGYPMIPCAWIYVALRYAHSAVHLTANDVRVRFQIYAASGMVLVVMWTILLAQLLLA